jgi:hypothetical protein
MSVSLRLPRAAPCSFRDDLLIATLSGPLVARLLHRHKAADLLSQVSGPFPLRPRQDSNLRSRLRRAVLYPLSYGGSGTQRYQPHEGARTRAPGGAPANLESSG